MTALHLLVVLSMGVLVWAVYRIGRPIWPALREWIKFKRQTWGRG